MRVHKDLFPQVYSFSRLRRSFYAAAKGKGDRDSVAKFGFALEKNLLDISFQLKEGTYSFGPYRSFYVNEPKRRLIESACFPDRVIHHSIHSLLETIYDPGFYEHNYACRSGRGHHAAMLKVRNWIKGAPHRYFLKCDIRRFFPSVDRGILLDILGRTIKDKAFMECLEKLVHTAPGSGIPIGNLTSQLFANLYLNELDQFVKRRLRIRHYIRYMDDFVLFVDSSDEARRLRQVIEEFTTERLKLVLSPHKVMIGPCREGMAFVGFYVRPDSIRLRGSLLRKLKRRLVTAQHEELKGKSTRYNPSPLRSTICSYAGHIRFCSNQRYLQELLLDSSAFLYGGHE